MERFGWWIAKPANCDKVYAVAFVFVGVAWWLLGDYSPLP